MTVLRIFVSSPGDVGEERALAEEVIRRLQVEFAQSVGLEPIFWEHEPLRANRSFQEQIPLPSETDIFICILWSRLGSRLPKNITRPDGTRFASGTEFEFEDAVKGFQHHKTPDLLVYRKMATATAELSSEQEVLDKLAQKKALDAFLEKWFRDDDGSFKAAFHPYIHPAEFEERLEEHLRKLIAERLPNQTTAAQTILKPLWEGSPFRGLQTFDLDHASIFFGRTRAISDVLDRLRRQAAAQRAFVLIVGMSGGGKSSLAKAGVLPRLMRPGVVEGIGLWRHAIMHPGEKNQGDLIEGLAQALLVEQALPELERMGMPPEELANLLRKTPQAAIPTLRLILAKIAEELKRHEQLQTTPEVRLVLLVDQLEELFTLERITVEQRQGFMAALSVLARCGCVWVIATLRSDYYTRCMELAELMALKEGEGQYDLQVPTAPEISQMIREPARMAALRFFEDPVSGERLDDTLRDAALRHPESLPLLEFTLEELYKARKDDGTLTQAAYQAMGGLEGAIGSRAESVFQTLDSAAQMALPPLIAALVVLDSKEQLNRQTETFTRHWAPLEKLTGTTESKRLIDSLIAARLLVAERDTDGNAIISIAHEALLRHWPRLQKWLEENKTFLRTRARIAAAALRWYEEERLDDFLLAEGKPLKEAKSLLARRADLNTETIGFIERSIAKNRRKKIGYGLAISLILVSGVAYWDFFYREQTTYYENFLIRWGIPEGVMTISRKDTSGRSDILKFTRQGRNGLVKRIDVVNGYGRCPSFSTLIPPTSLIEFDNIEKLLTDPPTICTFIFEYKDNGTINSVKMLFSDGRPSETLLYHSIDNVVYMEEGRPIKATQSGAISAHIVYFEKGPLQGLIKEFRLIDSGGNPKPSEVGSFGSRIDYNSRGLPIEGTMLDEAGKAYSPPEIGMPGFLLTYNSRNRINNVTFIGFDKSPSVLKPWGISSTEFHYDQRGNLNIQKFFDSEGRLTPTTAFGGKIAEIRLKYDTHGGLTESAFFDEKKNPVAVTLESGIARTTAAYDGRGNTIAEAYFDENNDPVPNSEGFVRLARSYDGHDRLFEENKWLADSKSTGYARLNVNYDQDGNVIGLGFYDEHDKPVAITKEVIEANIGKEWKGENFARMTIQYDELGNVTTATFFDETGERVNVIKQNSETSNQP
ncbi:MAG: nSTAND1 domain-containing NTPase [Gammaproteobacteria bacterium]